jgi:hypothetical protein
MPKFTLTEKQYEDLKDILMSENSDLANHPEFFEETTSDPEAGFDTKNYIDERIELCKALGIDFWESAAAFSQPYDIRRLKALYEGQSLKEFEEKHQRPTGIEFIKDVFNTLEEQEGSILSPFHLFTDTELALLAIKFTGEKTEFQNALLTLPEEERECFVSKYRFVFILRHGKEKEKELISQFLTEYQNNGYGLCKN